MLYTRLLVYIRDHRGRDRMVVEFTTNCAISAPLSPLKAMSSILFEPRSWRGVLDTTLCDKVC